MTKGIFYSISKNFSSLIIAHAISKIFTFFTVMLIARFLGPQAFGKFSYGISITWIFLFLCDFGFSELFIRDASRSKNLLEKYLNNIITLKIFVGAVLYMIILLLAWVSSYDMEKFWIISIIGASVVIDSFMYFFRTIFRIKSTMQYEGILMVIESVLKLGVLSLVTNWGFDSSRVILISISLLAVSLINFIINLFAFSLNYKRFSFAFDQAFYIYLLKSALPFALVYIFSLIGFRIDIIMLSMLKGDSSAGLFNVNYKLIEQFILIPITLAAVYLPLFSKLSYSVEKIHKIMLKTVFFLSVISVLIILVCYFLRYDLIRVVYGDKFKSAADHFFILSLVLLPFLIKPIIEKALYALGAQNSVLKTYSFGVIGNIVLNIIFIPLWGINGAAFSTFLCQTIIVLVCLKIYFRIRTQPSLQYHPLEFENIGNV